MTLRLGLGVAEAGSGERFQRQRHLVVGLELARQLEAPLEAPLEACARLLRPARLHQGIAVEPLEEALSSGVSAAASSAAGTISRASW